MNFTQWKNFGYPGQELTPFEPVLARDNLVTLTNYGRLCSILFVITPVCHCLFGFFQPLSTVPLLLAAGAAFFLRWAAQRCLNDPDQLVPRARLLTSLFTVLIFLLGVYYDLIRHPTEVNVLICLVMLIQLLLFDARPGHNLTVSLSGLAVVVLWECYVPAPHRLINIMYCFLASLVGLYLAWHKTHNMFGMLLYAQREKTAVEKKLPPRRQSASSSRILSAICCPPFKFYAMMPPPRPRTPWACLRITCGSVPMPSTITGWSLSRGS